MSFNRGFLCPDHGPIEKAKSKTIAKVKYDVCPECSKVVNKWERPMNERIGRCGNCGHGSFTNALVKSQLLRCCKRCSEVVNTDDDCKVVREGEKKWTFKK